MNTLKAFETIEKTLKLVPKNVIEKLNLFKYKELIIENDVKNTKNLFVIFCSIFEFIAKEENIKINDDIVINYITLNLTDFFSRIFYDGVFDHKEIFKLPSANLCYKTYIQYAEKLNIDVDQALITTESYYHNQNVLNISRIDIGIAKELNTNWIDCNKGFATSLKNVEHFVSIYTQNPFWSEFFNLYLLYRQILDDSLDFSEDYINNELKSFGIFALVKKFGKLNYVNLKNPITATRFKLFVLTHFKEIYTELIKRFEDEVAKKMKVEDFYETIKKIEAFLPS